MIKKEKAKISTINRERLEQIDEWLADPSHGEELSAVLAALRGPDNGDSELKWSTTAHIRRVAFPKAWEELTYSGHWNDYIEPFMEEESTDGASQHFIGHVRKAAEILGIQDGDVGYDE